MCQLSCMSSLAFASLILLRCINNYATTINYQYRIYITLKLASRWLDETVISQISLSVVYTTFIRHFIKIKPPLPYQSIINH